MIHIQQVTGFFVGLLAVTSTVVAEQAPSEVQLLEVRRIWDRAPHSAFTDLARFRDRWYCAFREGRSHRSEGSIRLASPHRATTYK